MENISHKLKLTLIDLSAGQLTEDKISKFSDCQKLDFIVQWLKKEKNFCAAQNEQLLRENERLKVNDILLRDKLHHTIDQSKPNPSHEELEATSQQWEDKITALTHQSRTLEQELGTSKQQNEQLQQSLSKEQAQLASKTEEVAQLTAKITRIESNAQTLEKDLEKVREENSKMSESMARQNEEFQKSFMESTYKAVHDQRNREKQVLTEEVAKSKKETAQAKGALEARNKDVAFLAGLDWESPDFEQELRRIIAKERERVRVEREKPGLGPSLTLMQKQVMARRSKLHNQLRR